MKLSLRSEIARRAGLVLVALSLASAVAGAVLFVIGGARLGGSWMPHNLVGGVAIAVAFGAMVRRQPKNGAVWALGWAMVFQTVGQVLVLGLIAFGVARELGQEAVRDGLAYTSGQLSPWLDWLHTVANVSWIPAVVPLVTFALLLFPDGKLPSRRWRPVAAMGAIGLVVTSVAFAISSRRSDIAAVSGVEIEGVLAVLASAGGISIGTAIVLSIASLIVRYHGSLGEERRQIRWIAVGGAVFGSSMMIWTWAVVDLAVVERLFWLVSLVTFPVLIACYAVAILRYRLYDIDVVISRSVVIAVLAGFIAVVYVTVVVGIGQLVGRGDRPQLGLQVVATAIVAVAFQPLRDRTRRFADRLVLGHRATPYEVLSGFSRHAANAGDDATLQRIADLLAAGTGALPAMVWLRVGDHLRPAAVSGGSTPPEPVELHGVDLDDLDDRDSDDLDGYHARVDEQLAVALADQEVSLAAPVCHEGELLGAVTLTKPRSEPPTEQDEELTIRLASGLALVLRNARLTAELQERLREIEASRQRIVHAQDDARRKIERDLRAGARQQLAVLGRHLVEVRKQAADAGAARTAGLLEQLESEVDDAVATLGDLAHGIYPPLLEGEGLGPALAERAQRSPLPVTLHASGLGRYGREIEGAVYFCVLEALQNAAKYAQATSVHVRLESHDGLLAFDVTDDGVGFKPDDATLGSGLRGMADRLDTVGGELQIRSTDGAGTRITGQVPLPGAHVSQGAASRSEPADQPATVGV